jgi:hypothetical protein
VLQAHRKQGAVLGVAEQPEAHRCDANSCAVICLGAPDVPLMARQPSIVVATGTDYENEVVSVQGEQRNG